MWYDVLSTVLHIYIYSFYNIKCPQYCVYIYTKI